MTPTNPKEATPKAPYNRNKPRVRWNDDEKQALVQAAALAIHNGQVSSPQQALIAAQQVLPENRRRTVTGSGPAKEPWYRPGLAKALEKLRRAKAKADVAAYEAAYAAHQAHETPVHAEPPRAEPEAVPQLAAPEAPEAPHALNGQVAAPPEVVASRLGHAMLNLRAMLVDELAAVFVEAALKAMGSGLLGGAQQQVELADAGEGAQRVVFAPTHRSHEARPAVVVAGLGGLQHIEIEKRFAHQLVLRFVGADESKDKLRSEADKADVAVVMTKHLTPSQIDIVKARARSFVPVAGGLAELRATLSGLAHPQHH